MGERLTRIGVGSEGTSEVPTVKKDVEGCERRERGGRVVWPVQELQGKGWSLKIYKEKMCLESLQWE